MSSLFQGRFIGNQLLTRDATQGMSVAYRANGFAFTAAGEIYVENLGPSPVPVGASRGNGMAFGTDGRLYVTTDAPTSSSNRGAGIATRTDGALHITTAPVAIGDSSSGGLARAPNGALRMGGIFDWRRYPIVSHRGGMLTGPENTFQAFEQHMALGYFMEEFDIQVLSDDSLGIMHDQTVERTTTSSGNVSDMDRAAFKALVVDASSWFGAGYADEAPPMLDEVLDLYADTPAVFFFEAKLTGAGTPIVAMLQQYGIGPDRCLIASFSAPDLEPAIAAGYPTCFIAAAEDATDWAAHKATGYTFFASTNATWTADRITAAKAAGLVTISYSSNRRVDLAVEVAKGADIVLSDDPMWVSERSTIATTDPFATQKYTPGFIGAGFGSVADRGKFLGDDTWGYDVTTADWRGALQGWACPIGGDANADTFTIDFEFMFDSVSASTRWIGVFIGATTDAKPDGGTSISGYYCVVRQNGDLEIFEATAGVGIPQIGIDANADLSTGVWYAVRLVVTPTQITLSLPNESGYSLTVTDGTFRGGYFHLGRNGVAGKFRNVVIS